MNRVTRLRGQACTGAAAPNGRSDWRKAATCSPGNPGNTLFEVHSDDVHVLFLHQGSGTDFADSRLAARRLFGVRAERVCFPPHAGDSLQARAVAATALPRGILVVPRAFSCPGGVIDVSCETRSGRPSQRRTPASQTRPDPSDQAVPHAPPSRLGCALLRSDYPPNRAGLLLKASTMVRAAGPASTTRMAGKMNRISGIISLTVVFWARSSASWRRRVRRASD